MMKGQGEGPIFNPGLTCVQPLPFLLISFQPWASEVQELPLGLGIRREGLQSDAQQDVYLQLGTFQDLEVWITRSGIWGTQCLAGCPSASSPAWPRVRIA